MKGVILAGGKGTRLYPLTKVTNKHLLPVGSEPMIYNPIKQLISADIRDILIVTSTEHMGDVVALLGSGAEFGVQFTYRVQEDAGGIAQALGLAEAFSGGERIVVILGDNIASESIRPHVERFCLQETGARVLLKRVDNPSDFGIAALDEKRILSIEEKPSVPKSDYAVIGYYMYDQQVFDIIRDQDESDRGEMEITDVNNVYIDRQQMEYGVIEGDWTDAGTLDSWQAANQLMFGVNNEVQE
ncbi:sugar phosphate nucleotidyltransferase [Candidatus Bipolaricaulota bacterium]